MTIQELLAALQGGGQTALLVAVWWIIRSEKLLSEIKTILLVYVKQKEVKNGIHDASEETGNVS